MSSTPTTIRLDDNLRKELNSRLDAAGISLNTYFTMAAKQFVIQNRIPFEVIVPEKDQPTSQTKRAMVLAEAKQLGLIPDESSSFKNAQALLAALDGDNSNV